MVISVILSAAGKFCVAAIKLPDPGVGSSLVGNTHPTTCSIHTSVKIQANFKRA
jgi:hypothetical protein